jgi:hypothetical protein
MKVGKLTKISNGIYVSQKIVLPDYVVTELPIYQEGKEKTAESLLSGEHIEWVIIDKEKDVN